MFTLECVGFTLARLRDNLVFYPIEWSKMDILKIIHDQLLGGPDSMLYLVMHEGAYVPSKDQSEKEKVYCLGRPARLEQLSRLVRDLELKYRGEFRFVGYALASHKFVPQIITAEVSGRHVHRLNHVEYQTIVKGLIKKSQIGGKLYVEYYFSGKVFPIPSELTQNEAAWYVGTIERSYHLMGKPTCHLVFSKQPLHRRMLASLPF